MKRFWNKVNRTSECWEWTASKNKTGYGRFKFHGKLQLAHRVAWKLSNGDITASQHVCHKCDNPACVRPDHLYLGTPLTNAQDRVSRQRGATKETHGSAKLTLEQVEEIRTLHSSKELGVRKLAARFGVARRTIQKVISRLTWK